MLLVVNYKTYTPVLGKRGVELMREIHKKASLAGISSYVAPPVFDLALYRNSRALSQSADPIAAGRGTGRVPVGIIKQYGLSGSLINHSENRIPKRKIKRTVEMLSDAGLVSIVCASSPSEARALSKMGPDYVAVEPPELIGTGVSVSEAEPEVIQKSADAVDVPLLVGAGIHSARDVKRSIEMGASGVLVSSFVANSKNPMMAVSEIIRGFKK